MKRGFALLLASAGAFPQASSTVTVSNGIQVEVTAGLGDPTGQQPLSIEMARASGNSFYRIFWDQNKLAVFAYELQVDLSNSDGSVTAIAKRVMEEFAARYPNADAGKPVPTLSSDQRLGPLDSGESATVGLFQIPGMGLRVSETVRVKLNQNAETGTLRFSGLQVLSGGRLVSGPRPPNSVAGRFAMFYIPGRGGFFFSADPVPGRPFIDTGMIDGNRMRFTVENDDYDCNALAPILAHANSGQVWVYHDPAYSPSGTWTQDPKTTRPGVEDFFTAASDSLGWWLR